MPVRSQGSYLAAGFRGLAQRGLGQDLGLARFVMWFGIGITPLKMFEAAVIFHVLTFVAVAGMLIVYLSLSVAHTSMW